MNFDKEKQLELKSENFPQHLCKMCGKCCRSITASHTHEELKEMKEKGSEGAKVFIDIFKTYSDVQEAKKVVPEQIDQILEELGQAEDFDINNVTFYYCPHIKEDNKCGIYETRPECCKRAPNNAWSCMPPGCGFEGWQFKEREKIKKYVRKLKEYLITKEAIEEEGQISDKNISVEELKELIEKKISVWKKYGADLW
ncbi:MAG TPA: YkgJ family cysteine cluster protein [Candidatus Gastranaerophilales bacterium]|nr:YkgJ family cysteine cluster protein [Candidatus Gastranaerophilales bacterium]